MSPYIIIDRRKNAKGKSLPNRQRFLRRAREAIAESAKRAIGKRSIKDESGGNVTIPSDGLTEPRFTHDSDTGHGDYILPGNTEFVVGDRLGKSRRPSRGNGSGGGNGDGDGEDDFSFALDYDEYLDVIYDDLELPDLTKKTERNAITFTPRRAGFTNSGMPANLNITRTAVAGVGRRIALRSPKFKRIHELEAELAALSEQFDACVLADADTTELTQQIKTIEDEITTLRARARAISYLDDVDLRYNNFIKQPHPVTQAVMFCILDVSGSMGEREKIISKKFFILLYLFLKRRYANIEVVFIRHHDQATECSEEEFFTSRQTGGTVVSTAYEKAKEVITERYDPSDWNIYMAQASDGDNSGDDNGKVSKMLSLDLLPVVQHFFYLEIVDSERHAYMGMFGVTPSMLWRTINALSASFENITCRTVEHERNVVNVFREFFKKGGA